MEIKENNFVKYNLETLEHIERHLDGSQTAGSHFAKGSFSDARALIDYAYEHIQDYSGERTVKEIDVGRTIGYNSLVDLTEIPESIEVRQEPRGRDGYLVNMVNGVSKKPTGKMVIVAGPLGEGKHGFYTIYPGENAPPFPADEEKLKELGYEGEELVKQIEINKGYKEFWENHGFVKE